MAKHAKPVKLTIGAILIALLFFVFGQLSPPLLQSQVKAMTSKTQTRINESVEEFSTFYSKEISWPYSACQEPVVTSLGDMTPQEAFQPDDSTMEDAILSGRVLPWNRADLTVLLGTTNPQDSITVVDIKADVYEYRPLEPTWLVEVEPGGCGGAYQRNFELVLEGGLASVVDQGISEGAGEKPQKIKAASLDSRTWTVSQNENSELTVVALPTDGYYEFGISIHYMYNGEEFERNIGSQEDPYKVVGGETESADSFVLRPDVGFEPK